VEPLSRRPTIVLDTAHNSSSVDALVRVLNESFSAKRRLLVFSASTGKDIRSMLECLLGAFDEVILTQYLNNPRAVPADKLAAKARRLSENRCRVCPGPAEAWDQVRSLATPDDLICVTGSVFIAAEMREQILAHPISTPCEVSLKQ
jgi:dihydrofolate synthase/folylpolyglutamate synthase